MSCLWLRFEPMISCSVCAHPNDDLDTVCVQCGSFIQDRIPNLDFFSTMWQVVESPKSRVPQDHRRGA